MRSELFTCAFLGLLIFSLFFASVVEAASYPDLSVIGVGPWDASVNGKYVSGYRVAVANYGSGPSKNATLEFYVRTYDGKTLNRNFTVPAMPAGSARSLKFSMCNGTDGSFKNGYIIVNRKKAFIERSYKNNARNFGLKETIPSASNLTVEEYWFNNTPVSGTNNFKVGSYTSPLSSQKNITLISVSRNAGYSMWYDVDYLKVHVPGYMHENVTFRIDDVDHAPTSWDTETITYDPPGYVDMNRFSVIINGESLEIKNTFKEPLELINMYNDNLAVSDYTTLYRDVQETYSSSGTWVKIGTRYCTPGSLYTANSTANKLVVTGNNGGRYVAGWFVKPKGNFNKVTALYGSNSVSALPAMDGYYGARVRFKGLNSVGFQIEGSNLGFSNFKTFGFAPWTWRDTY